MAAMLVGCSKETISPTTVDAKQQLSELSGDGFQLKSGTWRSFYDNGGNDFGCASPALNCIPFDIVVVGLHEPIFEDVMSAIASNNATKVSQEFSDNRNVLKDYFDISEIDEVIDSNLTVTSRGSIAGNKVCFKFIDSTSAIKTIYPLTF